MRVDCATLLSLKFYNYHARNDHEMIHNYLQNQSLNGFTDNRFRLVFISLILMRFLTFVFRMLNLLNEVGKGFLHTLRQLGNRLNELPLLSGNSRLENRFAHFAT